MGSSCSKGERESAITCGHAHGSTQALTAVQHTQWTQTQHYMYHVCRFVHSANSNLGQLADCCPTAMNTCDTATGKVDLAQIAAVHTVTNQQPQASVVCSGLRVGAAGRRPR